MELSRLVNSASMNLMYRKRSKVTGDNVEKDDTRGDIFIHIISESQNYFKNTIAD